MGMFHVWCLDRRRLFGLFMLFVVLVRVDGTPTSLILRNNQPCPCLFRCQSPMINRSLPSTNLACIRAPACVCLHSTDGHGLICGVRRGSAVGRDVRVHSCKHCKRDATDQIRPATICRWPPCSSCHGSGSLCAKRQVFPCDEKHVLQRLCISLVYSMCPPSVVLVVG
jgi:hypothetical protein